MCRDRVREAKVQWELNLGREAKGRKKVCCPCMNSKGRLGKWSPAEWGGEPGVQGHGEGRDNQCFFHLGLYG